MQIGKRIIYNKTTGKVLNGCLGEYDDTGLTQVMADELRPAEIGCIDLPYGDTTLNIADKYHVDIATGKIVIDSSFIKQPTYQELQQQLLQAQGVI